MYYGPKQRFVLPCKIYLSSTCRLKKKKYLKLFYLWVSYEHKQNYLSNESPFVGFILSDLDFIIESKPAWKECYVYIKDNLEPIGLNNSLIYTYFYPGESSLLAIVPHEEITYICP